MFKFLKSLLVVLVSYFIFVTLSKYDTYSSIEKITPYLYVISGIVIFMCLGVLLYFSRIVNKKNVLFIFVLASMICFSDAGHATASASDTEQASKELSCPDCKKGQVGKNTPYADCWPCAIFDTIFDTFDGIVTSTVEGITQGLLTLVVLGYCIWMVYTIMIQFITFRDRDMGRFLTRLGVMSFKVLIIVSLLATGTEIFGTILNPLVGLIAEYTGAISGQNATVATATAGESPLSGSLKTNLSAIVEDLFVEVEAGVKQGSVIMCLASEAKTNSFLANIFFDAFKFITNITIPNFALLFFGATLWFCFVLLLIVFPFVVFDVLFRFCFFAIALPFVIAFWPFSFLHSVMYRIFKIFLIAVTNLLILMILFKLAVTLIGLIMTGNDISSLLKACTENNHADMITLLQNTDNLDILLGAFLVIFVMFAVGLMLKVIPKISSLLIGIGNFESNASEALDNVGFSAAGGTVGLGVASVGVVVNEVVRKDRETYLETGSSMGSRLSKYRSKTADGAELVVDKTAEFGRGVANGAANGIERGTDAAGGALVHKGKALAVTPTLVGQIAGAVLIGTGLAVQMTGKLAAVAIKTTAFLIEKAAKAAIRAARKLAQIAKNIVKGLFMAAGAKANQHKNIKMNSKDWSGE